MYKTIGILAHVDAGKTTFAEALLYATSSIRKKGRVDHKDTFLDNHNIEKERGITVFSKQAVFQYKDATYYLIDTPGHVDFSSEMERSLLIMDYAVIIISAVEGIQGHTETVWRLLRKHEVPTFFFINKTDREGADVKRVVEEIRKSLTKDVCYLTGNLQDDTISEEMIEFSAQRDEELFERYFNGEYDKDLWIKVIQRLIKENKVFPALSGSALKDIGIIEFIDQLHQLTITDYKEEGHFSGRVYKIGHDEKGMRTTFIKALNGKLKVRDRIPMDKNTQGLEEEKVSELRIYHGTKYESVGEVTAGQVFAAMGLKDKPVGSFIGSDKENTDYQMVPPLKSKVLFDSKINPREVLRLFKILESEEPSLCVTWDEKFQAIHIHVMGPIQLEVLKEIVKERFLLDVTFGDCEIIYKETIKGEAMGAGHFEPLRHYAEVHLKLTESKRDSGISFESICHVDDLSIGNQNLVKTHIYERQHHGLLTGSALTDVKVTLIKGRSHIKHTSGGDFREATYRALRQALEKAQNILLEPYYRFKIQVPLDLMGRVISDIQKLHGSFDTPYTEGDKAIVTGKAPVATFMNYSLELAAYTKGKGMIHMDFEGYDICHNQGEVIEQIGYQKDADSEYTSSSIFCSKGQAYKVDWKEADSHMHC